MVTGADADAEGSKTLKEWTAMGNDPHSVQHNKWPSVASIIAMAEGALGVW